MQYLELYHPQPCHDIFFFNIPHWVCLICFCLWSFSLFFYFLQCNTKLQEYSLELVIVFQKSISQELLSGSTFVALYYNPSIQHQENVFDQYIFCCSKESNLLVNIEWPLLQQKAFVLLPLDHTKKSDCESRHSWPFSSHPPVHCLNWRGVYHHWSATQPMGHNGSKPKVKGKTLGIAKKSTERWKPTCPHA